MTTDEPDAAGDWRRACGATLALSLRKNCVENAPESIINEAQGDPKRQRANR